MTKATIVTEDSETIVENPDFINCLVNLRKVAVDGEQYEDVVEVKFVEDENNDG